jgi:uncharacterized membrane protein
MPMMVCYVAVSSLLAVAYHMRTDIMWLQAVLLAAACHMRADPWVSSVVY